MAGRYTFAGAFLLPVAAVLALSFKDWSATLKPNVGSNLSGTATVKLLSADSVVASVQLKGGKVGETNPWHVHTGGCDNTGAPVGEISRYAPITIREDETGEATARLKATLSPTAAYSVNVHRSASDMSVIACGNLQPVTGEERER